MKHIKTADFFSSFDFDVIGFRGQVVFALVLEQLSAECVWAHMHVRPISFQRSPKNDSQTI